MAPFIPPGIEDGVKYVRKRFMRSYLPESRLPSRVLMSVTQPPRLSVSLNRIDPFLLEVSNTAPCEIVVQATGKIMVDAVVIAPVTVEEPMQRIPKASTLSFSILPFELTEHGRQKISEIRSKAMVTGNDSLDAVLSLKAVLTPFYCEVLTSRDVPLRIEMTN